jgi:hypothetical protein
MIETLYQTTTPEKGKSECYVLLLARRLGERAPYAFMEEHGRWDESFERFLYQVTSIRDEEDLTQQDALAIYNSAKRKLAERGFVYSFALDLRRKDAKAEQSTEQELVRV